MLCILGGRQYEDEGRRRGDDDHYRRGGPSRRENEAGRPNKYNQQSYSDKGKNEKLSCLKNFNLLLFMKFYLDYDRGNYRQRDRDDRNNDVDESSSHGRSSNNHFNPDSQSRSQPR